MQPNVKAGNFKQKKLRPCQIRRMAKRRARRENEKLVTKINTFTGFFDPPSPINTKEKISLPLVNIAELKLDWAKDQWVEPTFKSPNNQLSILDFDPRLNLAKRSNDVKSQNEEKNEVKIEWKLIPIDFEHQPPHITRRSRDYTYLKETVPPVTTIIPLEEPNMQPLFSLSGDGPKITTFTRYNTQRQENDYINNTQHSLSKINQEKI